MRKIILILFIILGLLVLIDNNILCNNYIVNNYNDDKMGATIISIDKINLKEKVYEDTIYSKTIKGIVLFKEFGRPDIINSNTIIGAHSGNGRYSFFTDLDKMDIEDIVYLSYKEVKYKYVVKEKMLVYEKDNKILKKFNEISTLTLFTCNEKNDEYRLVIVLELIDFI